MGKISSFTLVMIVLIAGFVGFASVEPMVENANASTIYVGGSGTGNHSTIQEAISLASNEDTIFVYPGLYQETIEIDRSLKLIGSGSNTTNINGGFTGNTIHVSANNVEISGFKITGGGLNDQGYSGIRLDGSSLCKIFNNEITGNLQNGILLFSSSNDNSIYYNHIHDNVRGVWAWDSSNRNLILNNTIVNGQRGIYIEASYENQVIGNSIMKKQYGVYLWDGSAQNTIVNNLVANCSNMGYYSWMYCHSNNIYGNAFVNNTIQVDDTISDHWDDGSGRGNYWSDYNGIDNGSDGRVAGDGVGDTNIPHLNYDLYPLMEPTMPNWSNISKILYDYDLDGVNNIEDDFPSDPAASKDSDDDGYPDEWNTGRNETHSTNNLTLDAFPEDLTQWSDYDDDGYGDNPMGNNPDHFPLNPAEWIDTDGDGIGDNADAFPENPTKSVEPTATDKEKDEPFPMLYLALAIAAIAVVLVLALVMRKKKGTPPSRDFSRRTGV